MSKGTEAFKVTIQTYLDKRGEQDSLFAETLKKEKKNIDDCITYILNQVQSSGCQGFDDQEIYNMAVHYYDEDDINVGNPVNSNVIVNHSIPAPKSKNKVSIAKPVDVPQVTTKPAAAKKSKPIIANQPSLF